MIILNINKEIWIDTGKSIEFFVCYPIYVAANARINNNEIWKIVMDDIAFKIRDQIDDPVKRLIRSQMMTIVDE